MWPRLLPFWGFCHTPFLFFLKILCILRTSSGILYFFLQPLFGDLMNRDVRMPRSTGGARAALCKLVDTLHDSVKQVVDVHGRSLLDLVYVLTYRREGESAGRRLHPQPTSTLKSSCSASGSSAPPSAISTRRSPTSTRRRSIAMSLPSSPSVFSPPCRTSCTE